VQTETVQPADTAAFLESNLPLVNAVVGEVARRHRVRGDALDEFRSLAFLKLVEHDYAVLRRFEGASSLRTYLTVVLQRVLLDYRNREWGRWRPSAAATRIGPVAVRLECLVTRDGLTAAEAMAMVGASADVGGCGDFVSTLSRRGAVRGARATLGEDAIPECVDPAPGADARLERHEQGVQVDAVRRAVRDALRSLPSRDHLLITLRFRDGLSVAEAARVLEVDAKPLYRRLEQILASLQAELCTDRAMGEIARELAQETWCDSTWTAESGSGESGWWRQSNPVHGSDYRHRTLARGGLPRRRPARRVHRRQPTDALRRNRAASL
jgi:RNA polymerase sigma factor for flagellar operon FliA